MSARTAVAATVHHASLVFLRRKANPRQQCRNHMTTLGVSCTALPRYVRLSAGGRKRCGDVRMGDARAASHIADRPARRHDTSQLSQRLRPSPGAPTPTPAAAAAVAATTARTLTPLNTARILSQWRSLCSAKTLRRRRVTSFGAEGFRPDCQRRKIPRRADSFCYARGQNEKRGLRWITDRFTVRGGRHSYMRGGSASRARTTLCVRRRGRDAAGVACLHRRLGHARTGTICADGPTSPACRSTPP